ncbi:MAG: YceI family protein [Bdellovibrionales bacterium]
MIRYSLITALIFNAGLAAAKTISDVAIKGETVEFSAKSNLSAIEINGSSKDSTGTVKLSEGSNGMTLETLKIVIPVNSLSTGIAIRDHHMKEKIFKSDDGRFPDVTFESSKSACEKSAEGFTCQAKGLVSMHGKSHSATIPVALSKKGDEFLAKANFDLALTDFGIEPPTHFGVAIENAVGIKTVYRGKITQRHEAAVAVAKLEEVPAAPSVVHTPEDARHTPVAIQVSEPAQEVAVNVMPMPMREEKPVQVEKPAHEEKKHVEVTRTVASVYAENAPVVAKVPVIEIQLKDGTIVRGLNFEQVQHVINTKRQDNRLVLGE